MTYRWRLGAAVVAVAVFVLGAGAAAQERDLSIRAFFGTWVGSAISESTVSVTFPVTVRDLDVTIAETAVGFRLEWTTVLRQRGDPENPSAQRKSSALDFVASGRPGVWAAAGNTNPLASGSYAWAHIAGQTLSVNILSVAKDGSYSMQVYDRTVSPAGMQLAFRRISGGQTERTVDGKLIKFAE
jgi:hypothetical protein